MKKILLIALFICFASFASAGPPITQGINTSAMGPISVTTLETSDDVDFILGATDNVTINGSTTPHTDPDALLGISHGTAANLSKTFSTSLINTATTGTITWGQYNEVYSNAVVTGTSQSLYGNYTYVTKVGADTSTDTTTVYGGLFHGENTGATNVGTKDTFGLSAEAVGDTAGTSRTYGLYVSGTGADTNYGLYSSSGSGVFVLDAGEQVYINATSTPQTQTEGALEIDVTTATTGVKAVDIDINNTKTTGIGTTGMEINSRSSAVVTSGNQSLYGAEIYSTKSGADTNADATNVRGVNVQAQNTGSTNVGTKTTMGGYFLAAGDTNGTSTAYGIYATASGADTNYAGYFYGDILSTGSITGVTVAGGMLATNAEAIAGTATDHITTPAGVAAATAILKNPLAFAQGVYLTGYNTTPITVVDNASIDMETNDFTIVVWGALPDWTPSAAQIILTKWTTNVGIDLGIKTSGVFQFYINLSEYSSTVPPSFVDGTPHMLATVVTRESAAADGSVYHYADGYQLGGVKTITAGAPATVSNASSLYLLANSGATTRYTGNLFNVYVINRALSAAEVLSLYRIGPEPADLANIGTTGVSPASQTPQTNGSLVTGKRYRIDTYVAGDDFTNVGGANVSGTVFVATGTTPTTWTNSSSLRRVGITLWLPPEGIQRDGWKDWSGNGNNVSYPASGYSFLRPIRTDTAEGLLSVTNVSLAADADTTIYTVPAGKRLVLTKAILVVGADAGTSVISIGADGAETDWLPNNTLSALDAAYDAAILVPVPNTTPTLIKSYAAGTVIQAKVSSHAGGATNSLSLFGYLY